MLNASFPRTTTLYDAYGYILAILSQSAIQMRSYTTKRQETESTERHYQPAHCCAAWLWRRISGKARVTCVTLRRGSEALHVGAVARVGVPQSR